MENTNKMMKSSELIPSENSAMKKAVTESGGFEQELLKCQAQLQQLQSMNNLYSHNGRNDTKLEIESFSLKLEELTTDVSKSTDTDTCASRIRAFHAELVEANFSLSMKMTSKIQELKTERMLQQSSSKKASKKKRANRRDTRTPPPQEILMGESRDESTDSTTGGSILQRESAEEERSQKSSETDGRDVASQDSDGSSWFNKLTARVKEIQSVDANTDLYNKITTLESKNRDLTEKLQQSQRRELSSDCIPENSSTDVSELQFLLQKKEEELKVVTTNAEARQHAIDELEERNQSLKSKLDAALSKGNAGNGERDEVFEQQIDDLEFQLIDLKAERDTTARKLAQRDLKVKDLTEKLITLTAESMQGLDASSSRAEELEQQMIKLKAEAEEQLIEVKAEAEQRAIEMKSEANHEIISLKGKLDMAAKEAKQQEIKLRDMEEQRQRDIELKSEANNEIISLKGKLDMAAKDAKQREIKMRDMKKKISSVSAQAKKIKADASARVAEVEDRESELVSQVLSLKDRLDSARKEIEERDIKLNKMTQKMIDFNEETQKTQARNAHRISNIDKMEEEYTAEIEQLEERNSRLEQKLQKALEDVDQLKGERLARMEGLERTNAAIGKDFEALSQKATKQETELIETKHDLDQIRSENTKLQELLGTNIEDLEAKNKKLNEELDSAYAEIGLRGMELSKLKAKFDIVNSEAESEMIVRFGELDFQAQDLQKQRDDAFVILRESNDRIDKLQSENETMKTQVKDQAVEIERLSLELEAVSSDLDRTTKEKEEENAEADDQILHLSTQLKEASAFYSERESSLTKEHEETLSTYKSDLEAVRKENDSLTERLKETEQNLRTTKSANTELRNKLESHADEENTLQRKFEIQERAQRTSKSILNTELAQANARTATLEFELIDAQAELKEAQEEVQRHIEELDSVKDANDKLRKERSALIVLTDKLEDDLNRNDAIKKYRQEYSKAAKQNIALEKELDITRQALNEMGDTCGSKDIEICVLREKLEEMANHLAGSTAIIRQEQDAVTIHERQLDHSRKVIVNLKQQIELMREKHGSLQTRNVELQQFLEELTNTAKAQAGEFESQMKQAEGIKRGLIKEIENWQHKYSSMEKDFEKSRSDFDHLANDANDMQAALEECQLDLDESRETNKELNGTINNLQIEVAELKFMEKKLTNDLTESVNKCKKLDKDLRKTKSFYEETSSEVEKRRQALEKTQNALQNSHGENSGLKLTVEELGATVVEFREAAAEATERMEEYKSKWELVTAESYVRDGSLKEFEKQLDESRSLNNELKSKVKDMKAEFRQIATENDDLQRRMVDIRESRAELHEELERTKFLNQVKMEEYDERNSGLTASLDSCLNDLDEAHENIKNMEKDIENLKKKAANLEEANTYLSGELVETGARCKAFKQEAIDKEQAALALGAEREKKVTIELQNTVEIKEKLEDDLKNANEQIDYLESEKQRLTTRVAASDKRCSTLTDECLEVESKISLLESRLDEKEKLMDEIKCNLENSKAETKELNKQIEELKQESSALEVAKKAITDDLAAEKKRSFSLEAEIEELTVKLAAARFEAEQENECFSNAAGDLEKAKDLNDGLAEVCQEKDAQIEQSRTEADQAKKVIAELELKIQKLQSYFETIESSNRTLQTEREEASLRAAELEVEIEELRGKLGMPPRTDEGGDQSESKEVQQDTETDMNVNKNLAMLAKKLQKKIRKLEVKNNQMAEMLKKLYQQAKNGEDAKASVSSLTGALHEVSESNEVLMDKIFELEDQLSNKNDEIELQCEKYVSLETINAAQRGLMRITATKLAESRLRKNLLKNDHANLKAELEASRAQAKKIQSLRDSEKKNTRREWDVARHITQVMTKQVEELHRKNIRLANERQEQAEKQKVLKKIIEDNRASLTRACEEASEAQAKVEELQMQFDSSNSELEKMKTMLLKKENVSGEVSEVKASLEESGTALAAAQKETAEAYAREQELKEQFEACNAELVMLRASIKSLNKGLEDELNECKKELEEEKSCNSSLNGLIATMMEKQTSLDNNLEEFRKALEAAEAKSEQASQREKEMESEHEDFLKALEELQQKEASLTSDLEACEKELKDQQYCNNVFKDLIAKLNESNDELKKKNKEKKKENKYLLSQNKHFSCLVAKLQAQANNRA